MSAPLSNATWHLYVPEVDMGHFFVTRSDPTHPLLNPTRSVDLTIRPDPTHPSRDPTRSGPTRGSVSFYDLTQSNTPWLCFWQSIWRYWISERDTKLLLISWSTICYLYFIFSVERRKRISSTKFGDMVDRRSQITSPAALKERSTFADVAGIVKICAATFDKFGKVLTMVYQKPNISLLFVSWCSNFRYFDSSSCLRDVRGLSSYLDR